MVAEVEGMTSHQLSGFIQPQSEGFGSLWVAFVPIVAFLVIVAMLIFVRVKERKKLIKEEKRR